MGRLLQALPFALRTAPLVWRVRYRPGTIPRVQEGRLRRLLRFAAANSAFYRDKYRGLDLARCPLTELPPVTKAELMGRFDEAVTDPRVRRTDLQRFLDEPANLGRWFLGDYAVSHTSGSQGQPLLILQDRRAVELFFQMQVSRGNARRVSWREALKRFRRPARLAVLSLRRGFFPSSSLFAYIPPAVSSFLRVLWLVQTDEDLIDQLNRFRPNVLTAYAGVLEQLAAEAEAGRLRLAPDLRQVTNNSEGLSERARRRLESAFRVHVLNNYATGECPFLSNGCPLSPGAHVNADWAILEVVDEEYRPVPAGRPGRKVLVTNLANRVQPFIRYEVGDVITMAAEPCVCGSPLPKIAHIEGRASDGLWLRDGDRYVLLPPYLFKQGFMYVPEIREWQAVQNGWNDVTLLVEPLPGAAPDLGRLRHYLDHFLNDSGFADLVRYDIQPVPRLDPDPQTGKFRQFVNRVGLPPAGAVTSSVRHREPVA